MPEKTPIEIQPTEEKSPQTYSEDFLRERVREDSENEKLQLDFYSEDPERRMKAKKELRHRLIH